MGGGVVVVDNDGDKGEDSGRRRDGEERRGDDDGRHGEGTPATIRVPDLGDLVTANLMKYLDYTTL